MTPTPVLYDAYQRPVAAADTPLLQEIAGRGRDDIFLGFVKSTGVAATSTLLNPDAILETEARGKALALYDEVLRDPKVYSVMQTRTLAVVGKEWRVLPASDEQVDVERADWVRQQLAMIPCFHTDLEQGMDAIAKGFAIEEVLWGLRGGDVVIEALHHRDPRRFAFTVAGELRLLTAAQSIDGVPVPARKFLHFVFAPRYENPYGDALMQRVYWYWWFKKHGIKFWVVFSEKFGMPTAVGKYPASASPEDQTKLLDAFKASQQENAVILPEGMTAELLEATRAGTVNTYRELCDYCDSQIAMAILGQTLTSNVGATGSFAAAKVHDDVRQDYVEADAKMLCATINGALLPWWVGYNFPPSPAGAPMFLLMVTPEADLKALAERDERLVNLGLKIPAKYFYTTYEIPEPAEGEAVVEPRRAPAAPALPGVPGSMMPAYAEPDAATPADALFTRTLPRGLAVYRALTAELARELEDAADYEGARARLDGALSVDDQRPLVELLHAVLLTGHLVGQADVLEDAGRETFLDAELLEPLPPEEALRFFRDKVPMTRDQFLLLSDTMRARAFTLARTSSLDLVDQVKSALTRSLAEGTPFTRFLVDLGSVFDRAGVTEVNPHHAETVFRTNTQTAYQAGRFEQLSAPGTEALFPLFEYHTAGDERVRPTHAVMHGVIRRRDDPVWNKWWPPNGFNCRCTVTAISRAEIRRRGLTETELPSVEPDKGFATNPARLVRGAA